MESNGEQPAAKGKGPQGIAIHREEFGRILKTMQSLPDQQRNILHLRTVEQFSISEIAELLDVTQNNVKANLSIARKTMRKKIFVGNSTTDAK